MQRIADGEVVAADLHFPEALRWHDGALWFSDVFGHTVHRLGPAGAEVVARIDGLPSGLGWLPGGDLLVVSMDERSVLRVGPDGTVGTHADLTGVLSEFANDMVVGADGRAYVGNYGFDADHGAPPATTRLVSVDPGGAVRTEEPEVLFPNGMVLLDEGRTLVVAETVGDRVTTMRVAADGVLAEPRTLAEFPAGSGPDGIGADADGVVWVACAYGNRVVALDRDGTVRREIEGDGRGVLCCLPVGDRLYVALAPLDEELAARERLGSIVAVPV